MRTRDVVRIAMYVALFSALEVLSNSLPLFKMPQGGSLSFGPIALVMASYTLGWKLGLVTTFISFLVMMIIPGNQLYIFNFVQFLCDYLFAYGAYASVVLVRDWKSLPIGVILASFIRFMFHNISGWLFFADGYPDNLIWGVIAYNASYIIPTTLVTFLVVMIIKPRIKSSK